MLSLGYPKINFQVANAVAETELLASVGESLASVAEDEDVAEGRPLTPTSMSQKEMAFKVIYTGANIWRL